MRVASFCVVVVAIFCACLCGVDAAGGRDEPVTSGTCGANVNWNYDKATHTLSFTGSGDMSTTTWGARLEDGIPWFPLRSEIERVEVGEGITSIGNASFFEFTSLTTVVIPRSVTVIGFSAFQMCSKLKSINIPGELTEIQKNTFYNCLSLTTFMIPETVTSIESCAFFNCSSLTSMNIPDKVTMIDTCAFDLCSSLKSVIIGQSVTSIGSSAFYGCSSLTSINIPDKVTMIGSSAFSGCSSLTSIVIPENVTSIGSSAFRECSKLTSVNIPDKVTVIDEYTFRGCSSLTAIIIPKSVTVVKDRAFHECPNLKSVGFYGTSIQCGWPMAPAELIWFSNPQSLLLCVPDEYETTDFCDVKVSKNSSCSALYNENKNICDEAVFDADKNEWVLIEKASCKTASPVFTESRSDRIQILVVIVYIMTFMFTIVLL